MKTTFIALREIKQFYLSLEVVSSESSFSNYITELTILLHSHTIYMCVYIHIYSFLSFSLFVFSIPLFATYLFNIWPWKIQFKAAGITKGNTAKQGNMVLKKPKNSFRKTQHCDRLDSIPSLFSLHVSRNALVSSASYFLYSEPNVGPETKLALELNHISTWQYAAKYSGSLAVVKTPLLPVGFSLRRSSHTEL